MPPSLIIETFLKSVLVLVNLLAGSHMQIVHVNSMNFILVYISFKVMVMSLQHLDFHGVFRSWSPISHKPGLKPCSPL